MVIEHATSTSGASQNVSRRDLVGETYVVPGGDFAHFMGRATSSAASHALTSRVSGSRTLEAALRAQLQQLGAGSLKRIAGYAKVSDSVDALRSSGKRPFGEEALQTMQNHLELGHEASLRYLEMQYQFSYLSQNTDCISNLLKARHESTRKAFTEIR